ncbi:MAG: hypothetical protein OEL20_04790 [Sulfuritalea sp.]|nr:hypothetical protein [Sulfuritalea sp.]
MRNIDLSPAWEAVVRYRVYRSELDAELEPTIRTLHSRQTYPEARRLQALAEAAVKRELKGKPGYGDGALHRPVICIEIDNCEEVFAAFRRLCAERDITLARETSQSPA